ncbi:MAG: hypothetical protein ABEJ06_02355 [Haloarculaceae archaeon]
MGVGPTIPHLGDTVGQLRARLVGGGLAFLSVLFVSVFELA